jgi:hypothetical protein
MNNVNRNLKISIACASLMLVVGAAVQLFSVQTQRQQTALMESLEQGSQYVITNTSNAQACASVSSGQVLWECKGSTCSRQETMECLNATETLSAFAEDATQASSMPDGDVAGVNDVVNDQLCTRPGVGYTGQSGCWSKRKLSVVGSPRLYFMLDSAGTAIDAGQFNKGAHNDLSVTSRQYDVSKNESVKWAIALKNNSSSSVSDTYMFSIGKVTEAPKGVAANSKTLLCEAQLNELNKASNLVQVPRTIFSGKPYTLAAGQQKLIHGEWKPTKADCGLYQLDLGASDFQGSTGKTQCANPTADSVVAAAFIRVVGCDTTPLSCSNAVFKNENGTATISSAKPGEVVSINISLSRSPKEIGATAPVYVTPQFGPNLSYMTYIYPVEPTQRCTKTGDAVQCTFDANSTYRDITLVAKVSPTVAAGTSITLPIKVMYQGVDVTNVATATKGNCSPSLTVTTSQGQTISCTKTFANPVLQTDGTYRVPATVKITATGGVPANLNVKDFAIMRLSDTSTTTYSGTIKSILPLVDSFSCRDWGRTYPNGPSNQIQFGCQVTPQSFVNNVATYNYGFTATKGTINKETLSNTIQVFSGTTKLAECNAVVTVPAKPVPTTCNYIYSAWVEQYRADHAKPTDRNSPKALTTITVPQGASGQKVKVIYEYMPVRDNLGTAATGIAEFQAEANPARCAPQANEETLMYLSTENTVSKQITAVHRFADNKKTDGVTENKKFEFALNPGVYSLNARWAGDGTIYCTRDAAINPAACKTNGQNILGEFIKDLNYKYKADLTNPASPMITYNTAIKEAPKYGPLCKWSGSYKVRAGWCLVEPMQTIQPIGEVHSIEVTLSNSAMFVGSAVEILVNGVKQTVDGSTTVMVPANSTKVVKFNYLNKYPQKTLVLIKSLGGTSKVKKLNVTRNGASIYTSIAEKDVTATGVTYEYATSN